MSSRFSFAPSADVCKLSCRDVAKLRLCLLTEFKNCHSEERSDEESVVCRHRGKADFSLRSK